MAWAGNTGNWKGYARTFSNAQNGGHHVYICTYMIPYLPMVKADDDISIYKGPYWADK